MGVELDAVVSTRDEGATLRSNLDLLMMFESVDKKALLESIKFV